MDASLESFVPPVAISRSGAIGELFDIIQRKLREKIIEKAEEKAAEERKRIEAEVLGSAVPSLSDTERKIIVSSVPLPHPSQIPLKVVNEVKRFVGDQVVETLFEGSPRNSASVSATSPDPAIEMPPMWRRDP